MEVSTDITSNYSKHQVSRMHMPVDVIHVVKKKSGSLLKQEGYPQNKTEQVQQDTRTHTITVVL